MKNTSHFALIPILLLIAAIAVWAQVPADREEMQQLIGRELKLPEAANYTLTVEEAANLAVENNLSLVSQAADLRIKKRTRDTAWNILIPTVSASSTLERYDTPNIFGYDGSLNARISFELRLNPQLWYGFRQTTIDYELGLIDMAQARKSIRTNVKKQFYTLLTLEEQIAILTSQRRSLERRFEQASTNYDFGLVDEYTKLSAQVALENFKPQVEIAIDRYDQARLGFKLSLGVDLDAEIGLVGGMEIEPETYDADVLIQNYILDRLDVQSLVANLYSLENARRLSVSGLLPTLTLGYGLSRSLKGDPWSEFSLSGDEWEDGQGDRTLSFTLSVSLSELLPVSSSVNEIKEVDDGKTALRANLAQTMRAAELEIITAVQQVNKSVQVIRAKELNVDLAQRAYNLAEESYNAGGRSLLDVEDAADKLQEAQFELLSEKVNYINSRIDLEAAINRPIDEIEGIR